MKNALEQIQKCLKPKTVHVEVVGLTQPKCFNFLHIYTFVFELFTNYAHIYIIFFSYFLCTRNNCWVEMRLQKSERKIKRREIECIVFDVHFNPLVFRLKKMNMCNKVIVLNVLSKMYSFYTMSATCNMYV